MTHQTFVLTSYAVAAAGLGVLFAWLLFDGYRQRALLRGLQKRNGSRRGKQS